MILLAIGLACLFLGFAAGLWLNVDGVTRTTRQAPVQEPENRSDEGEAGS